MPCDDAKCSSGERPCPLHGGISDGEAERTARAVYTLCVAPDAPWLGREAGDYETVQGELVAAVKEAWQTTTERGVE